MNKYVLSGNAWRGARDKKLAGAKSAGQLQTVKKASLEFRRRSGEIEFKADIQYKCNIEKSGLIERQPLQ